jgi:dTDP-4-dehydrorhamnose 3,5-epimerase
MIRELSIQGLKVISLKIFNDDRGFFVERYKLDRFSEHGLPPFVQDNHSRSKPGVIRGLHYQTNPGQGKLVGVIRGRIWDVAVDLRRDSPTFGKWEALELNDADGNLLWIPPGFAHGFCVLGSEDADVFYKVDSLYNAKGEGGIRFDDPGLKINWPVSDPIVSVRDRAMPSLSEFLRQSKGLS